jgi:hypothetical protein
MDALADVMSTPTFDAMELDRALENTPYEEWEEFRMFSAGVADGVGRRCAHDRARADDAAASAIA